MNTLCCGDNLPWLKTFSDNYVDLIYLDPPFQSGVNYNLIFQTEAKKKKGATSQIKAFTDTWKWGEDAVKEYQGLIDGTLTREKPNLKLLTLIKAMMGYLGESSMMAYLCKMSPRLLEMHRVLKDTGSIYLHCDPTSSHYLKLLMDSIFGVENFQNEIIWWYGQGGASKKRFAKKHDIIFFYSKSESYIYNLIRERNYYNSPFFVKKSDLEKEDSYYKKDYQGRLYAEILPQDVWKIPSLINISKERLGYPTQKPEALLERIIKASSNEGDLVLDPFCGCGTAVAVAQKFKRRWIGIDISLLSIEVIVKRFIEKGQIELGKHFDLKVFPNDQYSEESIKKNDPNGYEAWCRAAKSAKEEADNGDLGLLPKYDRNEVLKKLGVKEKR